MDFQMEETKKKVGEKSTTKTVRTHPPKKTKIYGR